MSDIKKVKIENILQSQIPEFLNEESPLFRSFLSEYYNSLEHFSGAIDLAVNISDYKNIENFTFSNLNSSTVTTSEVLSFDDVIFVESTEGWPDSYGLLKIDNEIITYKQKTSTSFVDCVRGFSGIDRIKSVEDSKFLTFSSTAASEHSSGSTVENLSNLFIREFFEKYKSEFLPGFESRNFVEDLSIKNILLRAKDFYTSKGTDTSYKILFKILYNKDIQIIKPQDFTIIPSSNSYFTTKNVLVEKISGGDPIQIRGNFLFQNISGIGTVSASIFNVEFRPLENKNLYEVSLDSTSLSGNFQVSGKTKILEEVPAGADNILVDSTIGFSKSGKILVTPRNSNTIELFYSDKTNNQFLGVTGIDRTLDYGLDIVEEKFAFSYIGFGNTSRVDFRIVNVIDSVDFSKTSNLKVGDKITLSGFGRDLSDSYQFNSWIYNIPTNHNIKDISQLDGNKFRVVLFDKVSFYKNEKIKLNDGLGNKSDVSIISVEFDSGDTIRKYSNRLVVQVLNPNFNTLNSKILEKVIYKSNHYLNLFDGISKIPSGVQNTYIDSEESNFYVTSTGLPNYSIFVKNTEKTVSSFGVGSTDILRSENHTLTTGDSIYYDPISSISSGIATGYYFVTKVDNNLIKISYSNSDLFSKKYIILNSGITSDRIFKSGYEGKTIKNQKLLKKFRLNKSFNTFDDKNDRTTNNREVGLLSNGVELLSPTLFDENVYYGKVSSIDVTNSGSGYDIINVAPIEIKDNTGTGAKAHVNLVGEVKYIKVITPGIGYQTKPKITISGGNGFGCILESNLIKSRISVGFRPEASVNPATNTITFLNNHNFDDAEEVVYRSSGNNNIGGLVDGSYYYVGIISSTSIKIFNTFEESVKKINEIDITGISSGFHVIETIKSKNTITQVYVKDPGRGYSNRKIKVPSELSVQNNIGINTFDSYICATNHRFSDGELVEYSTTGNPISGLSTNIQYYVKVIDENKFKLADAGIGTTSTRDNYINNIFVKFSSLGFGTHTIGYPPIKISVESLSAIGSTSIVQPLLEPIVLGSISDVYLEDGGISYGSTNIINYHRRPDIGFSSITSECILKPIIINGIINDIKIINKGRGYRRDSDILIQGNGQFAQIDPVIEDGRVTAVNIISGGVGYASSNTVLTVVNRGIDAKFLGNVFEWKINQVVKSAPETLEEDDGVLYPSKNPASELQFIHFYVPKKIRYQLNDNFTDTNKENLDTLSHSPIIGFAYDGNPIYGPYGYDPLSGGSIRQVKTSYELRINTSPGVRPPGFEPGYFINDYVYTGSGDLDEYNGRWCLTPQYPNGIYAYFTSISIDATGKSNPIYPYVVGPYFKDQPIKENFLPSFNQDLDISSFNITRNVGPYYLNFNNSYYDLIDRVSDNYKQEFRIQEVNSSGITSTSIFSSGRDYQIGDRLVIDNANTSGSGTNIIVSKVKGPEVTSFSVVDNKIDKVNFDIKSRKVICRTENPHELINNETIILTGVSTITSSSLEGKHVIRVIDKTVDLLDNIDDETITGLSTFITVKDVSGFSSNDFIGIGTEILQITRISTERSAFYVNRIENPGIHTVGLDTIRLLPTEFSFDLSEPNSDFVSLNEIIFFDPKETVGTGTAGIIRSLVGIGTSTIENRFIPAKSIYLPNHKFYTGQPLTYYSGFNGLQIYYNNVGSATSSPLNDGQTVYAVNLGINYIGLSTVGFTSSVGGIGTTLNCVEFVNFDDIINNVGSSHSFTTQNPQITATLERFTGIVETTTDHNLSTGDEIELKIFNNEVNTVKILYNPEIRKITGEKIEFDNTDIYVNENEIDLPDNEFKTGDKVVYVSSSPADGLENNGVYYIIKTDFNKIKLCKNRSDINTNIIINITSTGGATHGLYLINPPLHFVDGNIIRFDISDSSISDMYLEFYADTDFQKKLEIIGNTDTGFAITRSGDAGFSGSYVDLNTSIIGVPKLLYYNLIPKSPIDDRKNQITSDRDVVGNNKIVLKSHLLNDKFKVSRASDKVFTFNFKNKPNELEKNSYLTANVEYTTNSQTAYGPISNLRINFSGRGYTKLPYVSEIISEKGRDAVIKLNSPNIGKVESLERIKDGFDYPTDPTLSPLLSVPSVIGIKDIRTINYVGIITGGRNYNTAPILFVKDNQEIKLQSQISGGSVVSVNIVQNVTNLSESLEILPIYNSNGYDIDFITVVGNSVTLELANSSNSNPLISIGYGKTEVIFPFEIGDQIFIEGCRLTGSTRSKANFNSSSYNYKFFTVVGINSVNNTVTYDMTGISTGAFGTYEDGLTLGYVVNKKDMPVFDMILSDDVKYFSKEKVTSRRFSSIVMENGWDNDLNQLRTNNSFGELKVGDKITGEDSKITGTVEYHDSFNLKSTLGPSRDKVGSIDNSVGILNDFNQRISDNFYYQKFSYSIKSEIPYDIWRESVRSIIHPSGFKEFSDLEIYTKATPGIGRTTNLKPSVLDRQSSFLVNVDSYNSFYEKNNFALVYEEDFLDDGSVERVFFDEGVALRNYIINKTNKVIIIDDISDQFDGSSIQSLDGRYADASDLLELNRSFIQEEVVGFITASYPGITTNPDWDRNICKRDVGFIVDAIAHDVKYKSNNKSVEAGLAYWSGLGTSYVAGESVETIAGFKYIIDLSKYVINNVAISTSYQIPVFTEPQQFETRILADTSCSPTYNENCCADVWFAIGNYVGIITTIIGIGTTTSPNITYPNLSRGGSIVGLTTFKLKNRGISLFKHEFNSSSDSVVKISNNTFNIVNHNFQSGQELIYDYGFGSPIGIATTSYAFGNLDVIIEVDNYNGTAILENGYNQSITTSISGVSTVVVPAGINNQVFLDVVGFSTIGGSEAKFNALITYNTGTGQPISTSLTLVSGGFGFNAGDVVSIAGTYFNGTTPTNDLSFVVTSTAPTGIQTEANNSYLNIPSSDSNGNDAIFNVYRDNDGRISLVSVVNGGSGYASTSVVSISGTYIGGSSSYDDITFIPSVLGTDKLPEKLFVDKLDDNNFRVSGLSTSIFFDIVGFGSGTHSFQYSDPLSSAVITIDGVIQTPIRRKSLSVQLSSPISTATTSVIQISSGISSISANDLINIDSEYLLVKNIGIGSTNFVEVERAYLGSVSGVHTVGAAATILNGDYNIVGDIIYFTTAPYGKIGPVGLETGSIFGGRVFSRKIDPSKPEDRNIILDDISLSFTGIAATEFTLKSNQQTTTTLFNDVNSDSLINNNPFIIINDVFQEPKVDYDIDGSLGNVIRFLSGTPSAGKISKVAITTGFGYQPLLVASAVATVSSAGTISSVVLTGSGSGYRQDVNVSIASTIGFGASITASVGAGGTITNFTIVNPGSGYTTTSLPTVVIGIPTGYSNLGLAYTGGSSGVGQDANVSVLVGQGSSIISFKIDDPGIGYKVGDILSVIGLSTNSNLRYDSLSIVDVQYDNIGGITTISTASTHGIRVGDIVRLSGIAFTCGYDEVGIQTFSYDNATGVCTVVTYSPHGLLRMDVPANQTSDEVFLFNLPFSCSIEHTGVTTTIFPDGTSTYGKVFPVLSSVGLNTFTMNAGISTIPHVFEGWPEIGITTFSYYEITGLSTVTTSSNHEFSVGDKITLAGLAFTCDSLYVGLTTTIFPDGTSTYGYTFEVTAVNSSTEFEFLAGISTIVHYYSGGGYTKKVPTMQRVLRYTDMSTDGAFDFTVDNVISNTEVQVRVGISTIPHYYTQDGTVTFKPFEEFLLTVKEVQTDKFHGFYPGQFIKFDDISSNFNGFRKKFTLTVTTNNVTETLSLRTIEGSDLNITNNIFVYINDILQIPEISYTYSGSRIVFKEAPKENSTCIILYYRGSSVDVEEFEPPKTIKEGDKIIIKENKNDLLDTDQFDRVVKKIVASDQLDTFTYNSVGILTDPNKNRPLTWIKQTQDKIISGALYSKSRPNLRSVVNPNAQVIKNISPTDNAIYVDNAYPLFSDIDSLSEDLSDLLISENNLNQPAICTSVVSTSSSVSSIIINDGGFGYTYTENPVVTISKSAITKKDPIKDWKPSIGISSQYELNSISYAGKFVVAVGNSDTFVYSPDGNSWQSNSIGFGVTINYNSIIGVETNNYFVGGSYGIVANAISVGNTISSWNQIELLREVVVPTVGVTGRVSAGYTGPISDITYSPHLDTLVVVGLSSIFSGVGIGTTTLISRFSGTLQTINSITHSPSNIIAVGNDATIISSVNGIIWDDLQSPTNVNLNKIIYADGEFVVGGDSGTILRSVNTSTFISIPTNISENIIDISYEDFYVILTSSGNLYYSFDLSTWIPRETNQFNILNQGIFIREIGLEGRYIFVGSSGTSIYSDPIFNRATAISSVTSGIVTSVTIINGGFGYSQLSSPSVLIEPDAPKTELIRSIKVIGDYGTIIGVNTFVAGTPGIGTTSPKIEFVLKSEFYDNSTLGIGYSSLNAYGVNYSQLSKGDYFVITNSNVTVGHALTGITTSLGGMSNYPNSRVGTSTEFLDGVYIVEQVTNPILGIVTVSCNFAPIEGSFGNYVEVYKRGENNTGINTNNFYGRYSWSKIYDYQNRILNSPKSFSVYTNNGLVGLTTGPIIRRTRGL